MVEDFSGPSSFVHPNPTPIKTTPSKTKTKSPKSAGKQTTKETKSKQTANLFSDGEDVSSQSPPPVKFNQQENKAKLKRTAESSRKRSKKEKNAKLKQALFELFGLVEATPKVRKSTRIRQTKAKKD